MERCPFPPSSESRDRFPEPGAAVVCHVGDPGSGRPGLSGGAGPKGRQGRREGWRKPMRRATPAARRTMWRIGCRRRRQAGVAVQRFCYCWEPDGWCVPVPRRKAHRLSLPPSRNSRWMLAGDDGAVMLYSGIANAPRLDYGLWGDEESTMRKSVVGAVRAEQGGPTGNGQADLDGNRFPLSGSQQPSFEQRAVAAQPDGLRRGFDPS